MFLASAELLVLFSKSFLHLLVSPFSSVMLFVFACAILFLKYPFPKVPLQIKPSHLSRQSWMLPPFMKLYRLSLPLVCLPSKHSASPSFVHV
jgi:hypothetical protein